MDEPVAPPTQSASLRVQVPADDPSVAIEYANNVGVTFSPHDMTLHFSWFAVPPLNEVPEAGVIDAMVRVVSKVSIPLTLVRPLAQLLEVQAASWEGSFKQELPKLQGVRLGGPTDPAGPAEPAAQEARSSSE